MTSRQDNEVVDEVFDVFDALSLRSHAAWAGLERHPVLSVGFHTNRQLGLCCW
jgi:hypothetical protein